VVVELRNGVEDEALTEAVEVVIGTIVDDGLLVEGTVLGSAEIEVDKIDEGID